MSQHYSKYVQFGRLFEKDWPIGQCRVCGATNKSADASNKQKVIVPKNARQNTCRRSNKIVCGGLCVYKAEIISQWPA